MGGGRGLGGDQAPQLFQQLHTALNEKEMQEMEGVGTGSQENNNQNPSFDACVANIGLWLQMSQICSQGLQESIAEARAAFPELGVLGELIGPNGPFSPNTAYPVIATGAPTTTQEQPTDAHSESDVLQTLMELMRARTTQPQATPSTAVAQPTAPTPMLPHEQLLQQLFTSAPLASAWNTGFNAPNQLPTTISAPPRGGGALSSADLASRTAQLQQEYVNLLKRQRVGTPTDHHTLSPSHLTGAGGSRQIRQCSNCGASNTPFWRKDRHSKLSLCNACGLYAAKNDHLRPFRLWKVGQNVEHLYAAEAAEAAATAPGQDVQMTINNNNNNNPVVVTSGTNVMQFPTENVPVLKGTVISEDHTAAAPGHNQDGTSKAEDSTGDRADNKIILNNNESEIVVQ